MNEPHFFDLYELPVRLVLDPKDILKKYYELSKRYHPDRHVHETSIEKRDEILRLSSQINQAKTIFLNQDATIDYVLALRGKSTSQSLPPSFLMDAMELNEELETAQVSQDIQKIQELKSTISDLLRTVEQDAHPYILHYTPEIEDEAHYLAKLQEYRNKKKYIQRMLARLDQK